MKFTYILLGILCLLCLFNSGNTGLVAQQTPSIDITVTNHETLLQSWRPDPNNDLTFEITVTVPADFDSGTLNAVLQNVTNYTGESGNVPVQCGDTEPDLKLSQTTGWSGNESALSYTLSGTATTQTMSIQVDCRDYAAYGELQLTASGTYTQNTDDTSNTVSYTSDTVVIKIPKDTNGNKIADCWRNDATVDDGEDYDAEADNDEGPNSNHPTWTVDVTVLNGDGISVLDEYRGLNVNGSWTDTDPKGWDVFILSDVGIGIGDACYLPSMTVHQMGNDEVFHGDSNVEGDVGDMSGGIVYHNQIEQPIISDISDDSDGPIERTNHTAVYAIRLTEDTASTSGTTVGEMGQGPPLAATKGVIYTGRIGETIKGYNTNSNLPFTVSVQDYKDTVIAHEIGHGVSLLHCPDLDHPNCYMWRFSDWTNQEVNQYASHHDIDYDLSRPGFATQSEAGDDDRNRLYSDVFGHYLVLLEDVNSDNVVNILDLVIVASNLGTTVDTSTKRSDVNQNGTIDTTDLLLVATAFGNTPAVLTELPEDVNDDGIVDRSDLGFVGLHMGTSGTHAADVNNDCVVNILDLLRVASALGNTVATSEE